MIAKKFLNAYLSNPKINKLLQIYALPSAEKREKKRKKRKK